MNSPGNTTLSWQVQWTTINSQPSQSPNQATTLPIPGDNKLKTMLEFRASSHASHLRDEILDKAARVVAPRRPQANVTGRQHAVASLPRKKRPASLAFDSVTEGSGQPEAENNSTLRPTKVARLRDAGGGCQPLVPTSFSKVNALPPQDETCVPKQTNSIDRKTAFVNIIPSPQSPPHPDGSRVGSQFAGKAAFSKLSEHTGTIENETRVRVPPSPNTGSLANSSIASAVNCSRVDPLLPSVSAPSSSIDGVDYLDDGSVFNDLLNFSSPSDIAASQTSSGSDLQLGITPSKMHSTNLSRGTPTPPSLMLDSGASPTSVAATPLTPSPLLKPFIRQPPTADSIANLPQLPSLKAEHRTLTCFRIAELLRLQSNLPDSTPLGGIPIELYARVDVVSRDNTKPSLRFADLFFPDRPPYLTGSYQYVEESTLFGGNARSRAMPGNFSSVMESKAAQNQHFNFKICRAVVQVKQRRPLSSLPGKRAADVKVLSIWETDWEDIERVRGIVEPQHQNRVSCVSVESPSVKLGGSAMKVGSVGDVLIVE